MAAEKQKGTSNKGIKITGGLPSVGKLGGKTPIVTCVVHGEVRHVFSVKILVSPEVKASLALRLEEAGQCLEAQMSRSPLQQPKQVSYDSPCWASKSLQNKT